MSQNETEQTKHRQMICEDVKELTNSYLSCDMRKPAMLMYFTEDQVPKLQCLLKVKNEISKVLKFQRGILTIKPLPGPVQYIWSKLSL